MTARIKTIAAQRLRQLYRDDAGLSTIEYAVGCLSAAAFGAVLYSVVTGDSVLNALTSIIDRALQTTV